MTLLRTLRNFCLLLLVGFVVAACGPQAVVEDFGQPTPTSRPVVVRTATPTPSSIATEHPTATPLPESDPTGTVAPTATPAATETLVPAATPLSEPSATSPPANIEPPPLVIVLDPGHDRSTPGALGIEYQVVLQTAHIAKAALEAAGYEVYLTREDNDFIFREHPELLPPNAAEMHPGYGAAYAHATKALEFDPDLVLMLHYNGHPNSDVRGIEIYYCELGGPQNLVLAEIVRDELVDALRSIGYETPSTRIAEDITVARGGRHFPSMGNVYDPPLTWLENRYAGIPVVLTEPLYMTNPIERPLLDDEATHIAIADAYVRAVNRYFGR